MSKLRKETHEFVKYLEREMKVLISDIWHITRCSKTSQPYAIYSMAKGDTLEGAKAQTRLIASVSKMYEFLKC